MALTVDQLGDVRAKLFNARTKWYDIGLALNVPVTTLDSIEGQFGNHSDKLREALKVWLKTAREPTWQDVVGVLKSPVVGEPKLASDIETKHCTTAETGQASGQTIPEVQQPQLTTRATELHTLQQALQDSRELRTKDQQLQDSQRCILTLQQELQDSQRLTHTLQQELQTKDQQLQDSQRQFQRNLLQHEQANKHLQDTVGQLRRDLQQAVEEKQAGERRLREQNQQLLKMPQVGARQHETITPPRPELQQPQEKTSMQQKTIGDMKWQTVSKAPEKMRRGSAAADSNMAYFHGNDSTTVYSYDSNTREWRQLPATPYTRSTLVVVHHVLTMVGGRLSGGATDSLLSLMGEGRDIKWLPNLAAMPTKRYWTAAVCSGRSLIVAGGEDGRNKLSTVEVLDTDTQQWSIASSLTHPFYDATISICGERLYMLGGKDQTGTRSVLSCSVPELLQSCQPQPLAGKLRTAPANQSTIWRCVADAPHFFSSCATLCGQLVAVGGFKARKDTSTITGYNETTDSWEAIGHMPTARRWALVAILNGKMMVVGGDVVGGVVVGGLTATDVVEMLC